MEGLFSMHKRKSENASEKEESKHKRYKTASENGHEPNNQDEASNLSKTPASKRELPATVSAAVSTLLGACSNLEAALAAEGMNAFLGDLGAELFNESSSVRTKVAEHAQRNGFSVPSPASAAPVSSTKSKPSNQSVQSDNVNKHNVSMLSGFQLTGWNSADIPQKLPKLPEVLDPFLAKAAFTHQGVAGYANLSYERLEWVGDIYMELTATLLISKTFSAHTPGKSSQMRERLVKNIQLAEYAKQYGFEKRIVMPKDRPFSLLEKKDQIKIEGDVFEAYIAAVVLSDPANGFNKAVQWLKDLWGMTLRKDIVENEKRGLPESPMWKLLGDQVDIAPIKEVNNKELLRNAIKAPGVRIDYLDAADVRKGKDKLTIFTVGVYLTGLGETKKLLATGTGNGKKDAGNEAARKVLSNPTMMKLYGDRKKMMEELAEREQAALASHGVHSAEQSK